MGCVLGPGGGRARGTDGGCGGGGVRSVMMRQVEGGAREGEGLLLGVAVGGSWFRVIGGGGWCWCAESWGWVRR